MCRNDACRLDETSYDTDVTQLLLPIIEIRLPVMYNALTVFRALASAKVSLNAYRFLSFVANHAIERINEKPYRMLQKR